MRGWSDGRRGGGTGRSAAERQLALQAPGASSGMAPTEAGRSSSRGPLLSPDRARCADSTPAPSPGRLRDGSRAGSLPGRASSSKQKQGKASKGKQGKARQERQGKKGGRSGGRSVAHQLPGDHDALDLVR